MASFSQSEVLSHICQELPRLVPLLQEWSFEPVPDPDGAPGELLAQGLWGGKRQQFLIAGLGAGFPRPVRLAVAQLGERQERYPDAYPVVAAPYLGPRSAHICKDRGCGYVDLSGNCFLAFATVYIREENHPNRFPVPSRQKSLYTPRGSRVVRALLEHPTRAWRQKDLAELTRTSPAHVHKMVERLLQLDFVDRRGVGPIRLREPGRLLENWQEAYRVSEHRLHRFYRWAQTVEQVRAQVHTHLQGVGVQYAFTQEAAASLIAPYTAYDRVTVYLEAEEALSALFLPDWRPTEMGANVWIWIPQDAGVFDFGREVEGLPLVGSIQLYLDLTQAPGRGPEQAAFLRQQEIPF